MRSGRRRDLERGGGVFVFAVLVAIFVACNDDEKYEIVYDCTQDAKLYGDCDGGSSYTCPGSSLPSDSDPTLLCESGHPQSNGATEFCCATPSTSTCFGVPASSGTLASCLPDEFEFTCNGLDTPSAHDPSLHCNGGTPGQSGGTIFCCTADSGAPGTSCAEESDAGCPFGATAYECPSSLVPTASDPSLRCDSPIIQSNGDTRYCCMGNDGGS